MSCYDGVGLPPSLEKGSQSATAPSHWISHSLFLLCAQAPGGSGAAITAGAG